MSTSTSRTPALLNGYDELADYLGCSRNRARELALGGYLPVVKLTGKSRSHVAFRRSDVDELIDASTRPATVGPLANA